MLESLLLELRKIASTSGLKEAGGLTDAAAREKANRGSGFFCHLGHISPKHRLPVTQGQPRTCRPQAKLHGLYNKQPKNQGLLWSRQKCQARKTPCACNSVSDKLMFQRACAIAIAYPISTC